MEGTDIAHYDFICGSMDLLLRLGIDFIKDGEYDDDSEPSIAIKYNFDSVLKIGLFEK
jgi:hypothetical protein